MCRLCDAGRPQHHPGRRDFLKTAAAAGAASAAASLFTSNATAADERAPAGSGTDGRRLLIRGGAVMSLDPKVGDFPRADVLIEGRRIAAVGPSLAAGGAAVIDARGKIVMPGFVDTHHHQFETALRGWLADGLLLKFDDKPHSVPNYYEAILQKFTPVYRPQDVHISMLFGSLAQLDAGVTTVHDISQIHHSPEHSDAAIAGLAASGRRVAFGYFEGQGSRSKYPGDAARIRKQYFASSDQLMTMIMGGEIYIPGFEAAWKIGRELGLMVAAHIVGPFGMRETFDKLAASGQFGPDNLFVHVTGMSDAAWLKMKEAGAHLSLAVPIEMTMRHGMPPILKALELGIQTSLSTDVECTMTADFFTQMRGLMTLQRALVNERALGGEKELPELLTSRDCIRMATIEGAKGLGLEAKTGSLTPGKEADVLLLDAQALNVAPLNHVPGAVVTLMDRTNVETVIVAGKIRKWKGRLLGVDLPRLRRELEVSRDYLFATAGIPQNLFR